MGKYIESDEFVYILSGEKEKTMKAYKRLIAGTAAAVMLALTCSGCGAEKEPVTITIWNYYNGEQLEAFNRMVQNFNDTVGKEQGITVESASQGSVNDLETNVLNAAEGKVGAEELPNIFSGYADTAYALDQQGMVVDLNDYLTESEKSEYIEGYLTEGDFNGDGSIKIFPTAKATEVLYLNDTDWQKFAGETGAAYDDLATVEGLIETAEKYYDWSDGKAFFGRDAMANYMLIGAEELGTEIFHVENGRMTLDFNEEVAKKLWDGYYVPYVKGYFSASGWFRSDDIKTGNIIGYVGSTSSATYFPTQVVESDTESHDIELKILPSPVFEGGEACAVQQGAGMVVIKATEDEEKACVEFLKWFTKAENNIAFSVGSGYLPVTKEANDMKKIKESDKDLSASMEAILTVGVDTVNNSTLYTTKAFKGGLGARNVLQYSMSDLATADRAVVEERMAGGETLEAATADFLTDEYFQNWYQDTLTQLQAFEG